MPDHSLAPVVAGELEALVDRINNLRGRVMASQDWHSLFSAARQMLPQSRKKISEPAELDLAMTLRTPQGRVLSAVVTAFSSRETYQANQRYRFRIWIELIRDFYTLCSYVVPPRGLDFAADLLRDGRNAHKDYFWEAVSIIVTNEPMSVRQIVSSAEVDFWKSSLLKRMRALNELGDQFLKAVSRRQSIHRDQYESWLSDSENLVRLANHFFQAFQYPLPTDFAELEDLISSVPRPPDEDESKLDNEEERSDGPGQDYWTLERIFEDL